jgi:cytochrome c peroxidase
LSSLAQLGEKIFHDESLSAGGRQSCASCHDEQHAFAQSNIDAVPFGGPALNLPGRRNTPSLKYLAETPAFFFASDGTPTGGFNRDGRAKDFAEQAIRPFLTLFEMANATPADVVDKLSRATYAAEFRRMFGDRVFLDVDQAFLDAREALLAYQREDPDFSPYTSKYDVFLAGKVKLSTQELNGLALFNDPAKGNCAANHRCLPISLSTI